MNTTKRGRGAALLVAAAFMAAIASAAGARELRVDKLDIATVRGVYHFKVEIADRDSTRERGLMFRKSLAGNRGMLFDFKTSRAVAFWMKNTLIPLDMVFITADGRILSIAHNAVPMSEAPISSGGSVLGVLEIAGGRAAQIGAAPGDQVRERIFHR